ncbi:HDOD domain-containing protein [Simiduia curdlanivorans]|uniref:HDOD domain-containing protein n=1 Tax=Simiduia curdlanivorans TaxID=1492769 RepID=A0ABV8V2U9_9GAMM|nr:HDOD domain-containing protein [Simiduia curdlanivorans]MDN3637806.1 HDOD domain-containing protein [Simiduia curdlanivorans]
MSAPVIEITAEQVNAILKGISIPPQPQIMVDLQMEQFDPNCSIDHIAKLISQDVGLSGCILKTVNSPFFGLSNKITSIKQAVNLLGIKTVINLVNAQSIKGALSDEQIVALGKFWDSAIDIAQVSTHIAKQIGFDAPDEAYSLGLFHNCGIPLLMMRFANYAEVMERSYTSSDKSVTDVENEFLATNHSVVGYYVAKSWKLPIHLCEAIHQHHQVNKILSEEKADNRKKTLLAILKMAETICKNYKTLGNQDTDYEWQRISDNILVYVGLSQYDFETLCQHIYDMGLGGQ